MEEIELSIMDRGPDTGEFALLLRQFESKHRCAIRLRELTWETGWAELVKMALYRTGPDVSEIGTSWMGNLVAMNGLRPFEPSELESMGGESAFFSTSWQSGKLAGDSDMWAIPWLADTREIYYRRDLLARAGVDESTAFQTPAQLEQTLERLHASGIAAPWITPTQHAPGALHNLSSWVWSAGGDFASPDGRRILFNQPEARAGIRAHLSLHRYLPAAAKVSMAQSDQLFADGQAAATISGPWLTAPNVLPPDILANTGVALPFGVPFVGGSNLVVWNHSRRQSLAVELVRFLSSASAQSTCCRRARLLPVRVDVLSAPSLAQGHYDQVLTQGLTRGRSFPSFAMWGLVEDELITALARLWADAAADPQLDLEVTMTRHLDPLAHRLNLRLSQI